MARPSVGRPFSGRPRPDRFPIGRRGSETAGLCQLPPTEAGLGAAFPRVQVGPRRAPGRVDPDIGPRRRSTERIARHGSTGTMTDAPGTRVPSGRGVDRVDPENPRRARSLCRRGSWRVHFSGRGADEMERGNMGYSCRRIRGGRHETSCFLSGDEDSDQHVRLEGTYLGVRASIARCRALRHSTHDQGCVHEPPRFCTLLSGFITPGEFAEMAKRFELVGRTARDSYRRVARACARSMDNSATLGGHPGPASSGKHSSAQMADFA